MDINQTIKTFLFYFIFMFVINLLLHLNWFIPMKPKLSDKITLSIVTKTFVRVLNCHMKYLLSPFRPR